jgi:hypothetical protein
VLKGSFEQRRLSPPYKGEDSDCSIGRPIEKRVVHCSDLSGSRFLFSFEAITIMESAVLEFWRKYLDSLPPDLDQESTPSGVFSFGDSKKVADELVALVRQGIKTATCSALMGYDKDQIPLPKKGIFLSF